MEQGRAPHKIGGMDLEGNFMKFSIGKGRVLHLGSETLLRICRGRLTSWGTALEKTLGPSGRK